MQVPFLQHWRGWKDVLFGRVAFENNVYKPYSYYINVALRDHQRRHVVVTELLPAFAMVFGLSAQSSNKAFPSLYIVDT